MMAQPPFVFCLVPPERADALLRPLREHFARDPRVAVLVERRPPGGSHRAAGSTDRGDQRAPVVARDLVRALPPELHNQARHLRFVQRLEPVGRTHEDTRTAELVDHIRGGDPEAVSELWWRFFERVRLRVRLRLGETTADEAACDALGRVLDELDGYDAQSQPLTAWLDTIVDHHIDDRRHAQTGRLSRDRPRTGNRTD